MRRRNSWASSKVTVFPWRPSFFSAPLTTGGSTSFEGVATSVGSWTMGAFPLEGNSVEWGEANTRPLRVTPLRPVMLVTLADRESTSVATLSPNAGGVYFHGTALLLWYANGVGLGAARGYMGVEPVSFLVKHITRALGVRGTLFSFLYPLYSVFFSLPLFLSHSFSFPPKFYIRFSTCLYLNQPYVW